jgi:hypothetical protein
MNRSDRELGMDRAISRRDFLNGVGVVAASTLMPGCTSLRNSDRYDGARATDGYPPTRIELRYRGRSFPFRAFDENRRVTQADIVSNKRLGDVVQKIQAKQRKRDEELLANKSVTLRRKKQIRTARAQADGLPGSS